MINKNAEKIKIRNRIGVRLFLVTFVCMVVSFSVIVAALWYGFINMTNDILDGNTSVAMNALISKTEEMKASSLKVAEEIAANPSFRNAVQLQNASEIVNITNNMLMQYRSDTEFVTITDDKGIVIARTHSSKTGDSVTNQKNIVEALKGRSSSYIEQGTEVRLSVRSSSPVKNSRGDIIGAISTGYKLDNPAFVDNMKSLTGADITIFLNDERINTTIITDGQRQVGTKLDPEITKVVIGERKSFRAHANILESPFNVAYEPIVADDVIVGVFFTGIPIEDIRNMESSLLLTSVIILFVVCAIALLITYTLTQKMLIKPVLNVSDSALLLAEGNLNVGNITNHKDDEIGRLTSSLSFMSGVLNDLIREMDTMAKNHSQGDIDARIDETKFHGAYQEVAIGINEMVNSYLSHLQDICRVLKNFGDGDFNAKYDKLPGKKAILNTVIEDLRDDIKEISQEIDHLSEGALNGELSVRANTEHFSGDWKKLIINLNNVMDAIIEPINEASSVLLSMSKGDLDAKVKGNYKGDYEIIKRSLNFTQEAISSYIIEIREVLNRISAQDLDLRITREYIGDFSAIKNSINLIIDNFNSVLAGISASAEHVAIGSKQISESSINLSQGATTQASAVEDLTTSISQVASQTENNVATAKKANALALAAKDYTLKETDMMKDMLSTMDGIADASNNISKIIKVIDDIAFQTNILALNAAIEAARAGVHGKGFAVVAEEVRTLASRSQSAAKDTTVLIEGSMQRVSDGVKAANEASEGLNIIMGQISEIAEYNNSVVTASVEQSENLRLINDEIRQVSHVTQENTAISEESAAAAEELSSQAEMFREAVLKFKLRK